MADSTSLLSNEDVNEILKTHCKHNTFKVNSFSIKSLSESGTGFLGDHLRLTVNVTVSGVECEKTFFVKSAPTLPGTLQYDFTVKTGVFEREILVYKSMLNHVEEMIQSDVTNEESWFPKYYFEKQKLLIVLDDLGTKEYKVLPTRDLLDKNHILVGLTSVANMHACMFWFEQQIINKGQNFLDVFPFLRKEALFTTEDPENPFTEWFLTMVKPYPAIIDLLEGYDKKETEIVKGKIIDTMSELLTLVKPSSRFRNILTHGDLWSNNIMYRYENEKPKHAVLIDFQIARYTPPAQDVMRFIYNATSKEARDANEELFKNHYYKQLEIFLTKYGMDINNCLPYQEFSESCRYYRKLALIFTVQIQSYMFTPGDLAKDAWATQESYRDYLMDKREYYITESFKDAYFKERFSETLKDLIDGYILSKN